MFSVEFADVLSVQVVSAFVETFDNYIINNLVRWKFLSFDFDSLVLSPTELSSFVIMRFLKLTGMTHLEFNIDG